MIDVNFIAVLLATVASMIVGFLWYGPLFGKPWLKLKGYTKESLEAGKKQMGKYYGLAFIVALITAYVLTHIMVMSEAYFGYPMVQTGLTSAFWVWFGFVMPVQTTATIFGDEPGSLSDKNFKLLTIDTGHHLVSLLVMGMVLGMMS